MNKYTIFDIITGFQVGRLSAEEAYQDAKTFKLWYCIIGENDPRIMKTIDRAFELIEPALPTDTELEERYDARVMAAEWGDR